MAGTTKNLYVYKGVSKSLREWAEAFKVPYRTLYARVNGLGWPMHKALTEPVRSRK